MKTSYSIGLFVLGLLTAISLYFFALNFHEVDPGQMYRSGQLSKAELGVLLPLFHIKTIINLRGENQAQWFQDEMAAAAQNNVKVISIDMSSHEIPDKDNLLKLIEAYHTAEKPLLVHDLSGADRAGEATALYQIIVMHKPKEVALNSLSVRYHHLEFVKPAKKYFIEIFKGEDWARNEYDPCKGLYKYYDTNNVKCHGESAKSEVPAKKPCSTTTEHASLFTETQQCQ